MWFIQEKTVVISKSGLIVLTGRMVKKNGEPVALKVGYWTSVAGKSTPFFTGREGEFFIEGIEVGQGVVQMEDEYAPLQLDLSAKKKGIVEMGNIVLEKSESTQ